jgi:membrane-anchored glycerophosphoryl diester phosphodiesterase (GDPDase)
LIAVIAPVPLRLRPLEIGDLLDETFRMYRRHFVLFAGISAIVSVPVAALWGYLYFNLFASLAQQAGNGQSIDLSPSVVVGIVAAAAISLILVPFNYGAVTYAVCESAQGNPVTAGGVFRGVARRYFQIFGYVMVIFFMGIMFCLLPLWIWIWVMWVAVLPVMFIENTGLVAAISRSWRLVEGRWWRTFLILFLVFILVYVVQTALGAFIAGAQLIVEIVLSSVASTWIFASASIVVASLVNPILQIAVVLIYFDLRVRKEGLDLFQLARQLGAPQAGAVSTP